MPARRIRLLCWISFLASAPFASAASTYTCTVVPINTGGASFPYLFPTSINTQLRTAGMIAYPNFAFVVDQTGASVPYTQPPTGTVVFASMNNRGQVAGWTGDPRNPWYPLPQSGLEPARAFLSNPDGFLLLIDPPVDTLNLSYGDIRVSSINDNGDILGEIGITDQGQSLTQYWFIRSADGIYTIFDPHGAPGRDIFRGNVIEAPAGSLNNSRTAVLGNVLRYADGSEFPITFRGMSEYPWTWWGINNHGWIVGNFARYPYTPGFSVLLSADGNAPAVVCPANNPASPLAFSVNDDGVIAAAPQSGPNLILMRPTGSHSEVTLSNSSWGFSPSPVGQQGGTGIIYLSSRGTADLNIESITTGGEFTVNSTGTTCIDLVDIGSGQLATVPKTFAPGEFCSISFTFAPGAVGARDGQLVIFDDAPDAPHVIRLNGTGLGKSNLLLSNNFWMAGAHPAGQTSGPASIYIYNPGTDAIDIASLTFSGRDAAAFQLTSNTCGSTVAPYTTCAVSFVFAPSSAGFKTAALTLTDNSPVHEQVIPFNGYAF
jgi:hypothetical protein